MTYFNCFVDTVIMKIIVVFNRIYHWQISKNYIFNIPINYIMVIKSYLVDNRDNKYIVLKIYNDVCLYGCKVNAYNFAHMSRKIIPIPNSIVFFQITVTSRWKSLLG